MGRGKPQTRLVGGNGKEEPLTGLMEGCGKGETTN